MADNDTLQDRQVVRASQWSNHSSHLNWRLATTQPLGKGNHNEAYALGARADSRFLFLCERQTLQEIGYTDKVDE
jgi:hypothetical protein